MAGPAVRLSWAGLAVPPAHANWPVPPIPTVLFETALVGQVIMGSWTLSGFRFGAVESGG